MRDGDVKENDDYDIINSFFGTGAIELNGIDGLLDGLGNIDMDKFGRDMEQWGDDFGRKMEKFGKKMEKFGKDIEKRNLKDDTVIIKMKKKTA